MLLPSHLKTSRHGVFNFRVVLPAIIANVIGQREIKRSLHTRCPIEAKATAYGLSARILPILHRVKSIMAIDPNSIDTSNIKKLIVEGLVIDRSGVRVKRMETSKNPKIMKQELAAFSENVGKKLGDFRSGLSPEDVDVLDAIEGKPPTHPTTLEDAFTIYLRRRPSLSTQKSYRHTLDLFARLIGDPKRMVHTVMKGECQTVNEALSLIPTNAEKKGMKLGTAKEIVKNPPKLPKNQMLSPSTVNQHLQIIEQFFDFAIKSGRYTLKNPIEDLERVDEEETTKGAEAFNDTDLKKIFNAAEFAKMTRPHQFWGPLIALFTGARSNEIAMLRLRDIIRQHGVRCFNITHDIDADEPTRTKNKVSRRLVPIHPRLWALGLDAYIKDLKNIGATRLFPHLPLDKKGKREKYLSRDFNEKLLPVVGVHQKRVKVFHSFRDTCIATLADAEIHEKYISQWVGHSAKSMQSISYIPKAPMNKLSKKIWPKLQFKKLTLDGIQYQPGRWNAWLKKNKKP